MSRVVLFILSLCLVLCICSKNVAGILLDNSVRDPDMDRNVSELITSKGYPLEEHTIKTADGYLLSAQRIPYGIKSNPQQDDKDVVLFIHGLTADASIWVLNFPNQSSSFVLADEGYDVWLLNTRGCTYSKKHVIYTTNQYKFWNFSFDQVAQFDIPATIDYILETTGKESLYIIGHSQGTTAPFAMLSDIPDYNSKVKLLVALGPVATVAHITSFPLRELAPFSDLLNLYYTISPGEFLPNDPVSKLFKEITCDKLAPEACLEVLFAMYGEDRSQLNETRLGVYLAHFPTETSVKSVLHYGQMYKSKKFCKYDYGPVGNLKQYNQKEPPEYNLSLITTPVALFWSTNDKLADTKDVEFLRTHLLKSTLVLDYLIPYKYSHIDFCLAMNAPKLINEPILKLFTKY